MRRISLVLALLATVLLATPAAVATGGSRQCDFNNDGYDDAAIGVSGEDVNGADSAGAVNVLYGSADGLISIGDQLWHQDSPGIADNAEEWDQFGIGVECGDFNGDGYADLVVSAVAETVGGKDGAGAIHLLFGSAHGLTADDSLFLHRDVPGVAGKAATDDYFGWSMAAGDFNGDGNDDLAIGVIDDDVSGFADAGSVHVLYGFAGGLSTDTDKIWHRGTRGIRGQLEAGSQFGSSLTTADFDGDGIDDLAIGARGADINGKPNAGSVNVIYGSPSGLTRAGDDLFHRDSKGIAGSSQAQARFGWSLAAGDFDNDGKDDLAIGVPLDEIGGHVAAGSVHVILGGGNGLRTGGDKIWHRNSPGVRGSAGPGDRFGYSLAASRFNSDGNHDLAIGAPIDDVGSIVQTGSVHVMYGGPGGLSAAEDQIWQQNKKGVKGANETGDRFGWSVATADYDGNGRYDLLIGVPNEDGQATIDSGRVAVIYARAGGLAAGGDQSWSQDSLGVSGVAETGDQMGRNVNGAIN